MLDQRHAPSWNGWAFEDDYLISPNGDRLTPAAVMACIYLKQTESFQLVFRPDLWQWRC